MHIAKWNGLINYYIDVDCSAFMSVSSLVENVHKKGRIIRLNMTTNKLHVMNTEDDIAVSLTGVTFTCESKLIQQLTKADLDMCPVWVGGPVQLSEPIRNSKTLSKLADNGCLFVNSRGVLCRKKQSEVVFRVDTGSGILSIKGYKKLKETLKVLVSLFGCENISVKDGDRMFRCHFGLTGMLQQMDAKYDSDSVTYTVTDAVGCSSTHDSFDALRLCVSQIKRGVELTISMNKNGRCQQIAVLDGGNEALETIFKRK